MSDESKNTEKLDETTDQAEVACDEVKETTDAVDEAAETAENTGQEPEKQLTNNQSTEPDFGMGMLLGALVVVVLLLAMLASSNSGNSTTDERLAACEEKVAELEEAVGISRGDETESATIEMPESDADEKAVAKTSPQPSATMAAEPTKKPKDTQAPMATLSPAQIDYFCKVLIIGTNKSQDPAKWDSPEGCAECYWVETWYNDCDEKEHLEDWYKVAAHPATTATLLHYVAYRCDDDWISKKDNAVKLAKLVLAHKNCDDQCLGYLSASDYQSVRDLVYERLLGE